MDVQKLSAICSYLWMTALSVPGISIYKFEMKNYWDESAGCLVSSTASWPNGIPEDS